VRSSSYLKRLPAVLAELIRQAFNLNQPVSSVTFVRDVFTSIFFVTIGMMIHFSYFYANFLRMFALLVIIFAVKGFVMTATCYLFGDLPFRASLASGLAISQAGEFTFVVASTVSLFGTRLPPTPL